jgi:hypothetical protein
VLSQRTIGDVGPQRELAVRGHSPGGERLAEVRLKGFSDSTEIFIARQRVKL